MPVGLAHHQLGGAGQLVDHAHLGDLELAAPAVLGAPQVDDRPDAGAADGDVGEARGATGGRRCRRRSRPPRRPAPARRPSRIRRAERSLSSGSRAAQPSSTLDRSTPALAHTKPCFVSLMMRSPRRRRIRTDSASTIALWPRGSAGSISAMAPSAFDTTFWVTTTTSPSRRSGFGGGDQAGQVVARAAPRGCPRSGSTSRRVTRSTTSASAVASVGPAHDRRGHHAPDALGLDRAGVLGVGLVDHQRGHQGSVEAGHADHGGLVAELAQQPVGRALERGAGDDRRHRDARRRGGPPPPSRTPGTASTGSIDTIGFDGAITTRRASADGLEHPGRRAGRVGPVEAHRRRPATSWWRCTKYSWKPISPSPATVTRVCSRSSVTGSRRSPSAQASAISAVTSRQRRPRPQAVGAVEVGGEVAVAEVEPRAAPRVAAPARPWPARSRRRAPSRARGRWRRRRCR